MASENKDFRILSLDGGGAKGVYTLGILREMEALTGKLISEEFDLIYGTSTGAIIAALLALGKTVNEVTKNYFEMVPEVMGHRTKKGRSATLRKNAETLLGNAKFEEFKTDIGIVATDWLLTKPRIFKASIRQSHGMKATFKPGFGATIVDALLASSAAFPFFERVRVETENQGTMELIDGGFIANNPTLLAIADGVHAYQLPRDQLKVLSLGVGIYKEPNPGLFHKLLFKLDSAKLSKKILEANTNTIEQMRQILFRDVACIRINDSFPQDEYATDLLESDRDKLMKINALGRESFSKCEDNLKSLFGW